MEYRRFQVDRVKGIADVNLIIISEGQWEVRLWNEAEKINNAVIQAYTTENMEDNWTILEEPLCIEEQWIRSYMNPYTKKCTAESIQEVIEEFRNIDAIEKQKSDEYFREVEEKKRLKDIESF